MSQVFYENHLIQSSKQLCEADRAFRVTLLIKKWKWKYLNEPGSHPIRGRARIHTEAIWLQNHMSPCWWTASYNESEVWLSYWPVVSFWVALSFSKTQFPPFLVKWMSYVDRGFVSINWAMQSPAHCYYLMQPPHFTEKEAKPQRTRHRYLECQRETVQISWPAPELWAVRTFDQLSFLEAPYLGTKTPFDAVPMHLWATQNSPRSDNR